MCAGGAYVVLTFCNAAPAAEEVERDGLASLMAAHAAGLPPARVVAVCKHFCSLCLTVSAVI